MTAPALTIRLELEAAPRLDLDCLNESEQCRLFDWLDGHPDLERLVDLAFALHYELRVTEGLDEAQAALSADNTPQRRSEQ